MSHLIIGAGRFSRAHINVLRELGVTDTIAIARARPWTQPEREEWNDPHLEFCDTVEPTGKIVHIVTPTISHLSILDQVQNANQILIEKPAVVFNSRADAITAGKLWDCQLPIWQNDWLSQLNKRRESKAKPSRIEFEYHVTDVNSPELITEVASHLAILLTLWCDPCDPTIVRSHINIVNELELDMTIGDIDISLRATSGLVKKSKWQCAFLTSDGIETFDSQMMGGGLFINTVESVLDQTPPYTCWYKSSWMVHKFRHLLIPETFQMHYSNCYKR